MPTPKKSLLPVLIIVSIILCAVVGAALAVGARKQKSQEKSAEQPLATFIEASPIKTEVPRVEEQVQVEEEEESSELIVENVLFKKDEDIPNTAFPNMDASEEDPDAQLAKAFTYDNLQDSMLTSGQEARQAMKSREAWSRLGQRGNPEIWNAQMEELKKEIDASGQTIEQFMENSMAPIPEQMAAFWKGSTSSKQDNEASRGVGASKPSRAALSEAASLTFDAMQSIPRASGAKRRMEEILSARKRAKSLGIEIPELSKEQRESLGTHIHSSNREISSLASAVSSV